MCDAFVSEDIAQASGCFEVNEVGVVNDAYFWNCQEFPASHEEGLTHEIATAKTECIHVDNPGGRGWLATHEKCVKDIGAIVSNKHNFATSSCGIRVNNEVHEHRRNLLVKGHAKDFDVEATLEEHPDNFEVLVSDKGCQEGCEFLFFSISRSFSREGADGAREFAHFSDC